MSSFNARDRLKLLKELHDDIKDTIGEHSSMTDFTVVEVVGVLELLKMELVEENAQEEDDEH